MRQESNRGFTLIELLIVVVIIGILAAIAIPKFGSAREKAFRASLESDLRNLAHAQELYYESNFSYSTDPLALEVTLSDGVSLVINEATNLGWAATASHAGVVAQQCGLFHGNAAPSNGSPGVEPGVIACSF